MALGHEKAGAVLIDLIDLTAAHDTVWHWGMRRLVQFLLIIQLHMIQCGTGA